ncbi:nitric-oxide synthase, plant [Marchantia polymorpha subsp. ruderalis]|uniref:CP-type G domain-containing protein n=2 Tax=Marchantia polymorpha TaxID=3197 RepID=A0AAF6ANK2_MARPO|nr:hypothetical protein MARPO_0014s0202 [Marchantia polymorpha]BBM98022.1 hypothetical protein Mp_1g10240 [Marchantia polymorpha subsp. ruderalis]|eukprot:PTQ45704.1 hypothetical protein MARPO_0014s0202 [Marchantia polymorpha]
MAMQGVGWSSCLPLERDWSLVAIGRKGFSGGNFARSACQRRTNCRAPVFIGDGPLSVGSLKRLEFGNKGFASGRCNYSRDSNVDISERQKPWKKSGSRPSPGEGWGASESSGDPQQAERDEIFVPGRDVAPVVEGPGERFLRNAMRVQDEKILKSNSETDESFRDSAKANRKKEGPLLKGSKKDESEELSKKKKKKKDIPVVNKLNHNQPSCYGCGSILQTRESESPGYIPPQTFEVKKKHHQLKTVLCGRCRLLSQGHMIPAVGGLGGYGDGKGFVLAEELRSQLSHLRHQKALIVKLVDIVDFNGSFLTRVRDLVGANPIILVLTKCDLLTEGTDMAAVSDWLQEATLRKKLNVISIHLTSSKAKTGISRVAADITRQRLGRDVYVLGSANVGKSAFVTALLQDMSKRDPVAAAALRHKPIQSAMPGTTLGAIEFEAFSGGGKLFDTPGVHLHHRMAAVVDPKDVALLAPRRRLRGYVIGPKGPEEEALEMEPEEDSHLFDEGFVDNFLKDKMGANKWAEDSLPLDNDEEWDELDDGMWTEGNLSGTSLFWGGVVRIDIVKAPANLKLTFFGPSAIRILRCPTEEADVYYEENLGKTLTPPTASKVESWGGLGKVQDIIFDLKQGTKHPAGDIAISGLGWITIGNSFPDEEDESEERVEDDDNDRSNLDIVDIDAEVSEDDDELSEDAIELVLHTPKAVEVFVRPSLPLGKSGKSWYEYEELDDEELAARPTVHY